MRIVHCFHQIFSVKRDHNREILVYKEEIKHRTIIFSHIKRSICLYHTLFCVSYYIIDAAMILLIFILTMSFTLGLFFFSCTFFIFKLILIINSLLSGKLQKIRDQGIINESDNTNKLLNTNPLITPSDGQEGKNDYPFYKPNNAVEITRRNSESEQFEQKKDTTDKTTEEENDYKLTSFNGDLGRTYSNESKEVNDAKQIKEFNNILQLRRSRMMTLQRPRVCYACTSINDPSCWSPSNNTVVKYCRQPNISCVSKTFQYEGIVKLIIFTYLD